MEVLLVNSDDQTSTQYPEVRTVDNAQMYLSIRVSFSKTISGIKELLLCAFEGLFGAEILISEGQGKRPLGMMVLTQGLKVHVAQHPVNINNETSRWGLWGSGNQTHAHPKGAAACDSRQTLLHGSAGPGGPDLRFCKGSQTYVFLFKLSFLSFNSTFRKYYICGAKHIYKLDVACGLWLSASVLKHCTC